MRKSLGTSTQSTPARGSPRRADRHGLPTLDLGAETVFEFVLEEAKAEDEEDRLSEEEDRAGTPSDGYDDDEEPAESEESSEDEEEDH